MCFINSDSTIECTDSHLKYHTGKSAGVSDTTIKMKEEHYRNAWRCLACTRMKSHADLPRKSVDDADKHDIQVWLKLINEKLEYLIPLKETVEKAWKISFRKK